MAASSGALPVWRLGTAARRDLPCCLRMLWPGCLVTSTPALLSLPHRRFVHTSPALSAKNYLHRFSSKSKKRSWYDSPWYLPHNNAPSGLMALMKQQQKEKRGNNVRVKALNAILYEALSGLLSTSEVSDEVYNFQIELSKVAVSADFSVCRAYWMSSGNKDTDAQIDELLQKFAPRFRHLMISHHVLGHVPPVVFMRDKEDAKIQEVEELLTLLKFEDDTNASIKTDSASRDLDLKLQTEASVFHPPSMFGIDHTELERQIFEYKKKIKDKSAKPDSADLSQQQQLQLAEIRKQDIKRKKMKKQNKTVYDNLSPQDYILANNMDSERQEDLESQDHLMELEEEEGNGGRTLK
ncbi:putative ribosome-binding factor A, mitochondrial [Gastrophryne carolinensis]